MVRALGTTKPDSKVEIKVIEAKGLPKLGTLSFDDAFYVKALFNGIDFATEKRRRFKLSWKQGLEFPFSGQLPDFTLEVYGKTFSSKAPIFIGRSLVSYANLYPDGPPKLGSTHFHNVSLSDSGKQTSSHAKGSGSLRISITVTSLCVKESTQQVADNVESDTGSSGDGSDMDQTISGTDHDSTESASINTTSPALGTALDQLHISPGPARDDNPSAPPLRSSEENVHSTPELSEVDDTLLHASDALARMHSPALLASSQHPDLDVSKLSDAKDLVVSLLSKVEGFAKLMDHVSEIHPYAKAAWGILNLAREVIKFQVQQDQGIHDLFQQMVTLYERAQDVVHGAEGGPPQLHLRHREILSRVARQTNECAYFIADYCKDEKFRWRVLKGPFSDKWSGISAYKSAFASLTEELDNVVQDGTHMVVSLVWDSLTSILMEFHVEKLALISGASLVVSETSPKQCLPGTRVAILDEITAWINGVREGSLDQRILLLTGMAGTGKSAVAHTIASRFKALSRLGASFAFSRNVKTRRVSHLFPHIARLLASLHPTIKHRLSEVIARDEDLLSNEDPNRQLSALIVEPLRGLTFTGPVVLVIDALDEAPGEGTDDESYSCDLASLLAECAGDLPANFRILITARPEAYILRSLQHPTVLQLSMPNTRELNQKDIDIFIRHRLLPRSGYTGAEGIDDACCGTLAEVSQGLFQWAAFACNEINPCRWRGGSTPKQRFDRIVSLTLKTKPDDRLGLLDSLYRDVLEQAYDPTENPNGHEVLKGVMAMILALMEPLPLNPLSDLYNTLGFGEISEVNSVLPDLASLLDGIVDPERPVQPSHSSFRDFFLDPDRSGPFCVRALLPGAHEQAARGSLNVLYSELRQRTPELDLAHCQYWGNMFQKQETIPPAVKYACDHWTQHMVHVEHLELAFWIIVKEFVFSPYFVHWIETVCFLSITKHKTAENNWRIGFTTGSLVRSLQSLASQWPQELNQFCNYIGAPPTELLQVLSAFFRSVDRWTQAVSLRMKGLDMSYQTVRLRSRSRTGSISAWDWGLLFPMSEFSFTFAKGADIIAPDEWPHRDLLMRGSFMRPAGKTSIKNSGRYFKDLPKAVPPSAVISIPGWHRDRSWGETEGWGVIVMAHQNARVLYPGEDITKIMMHDILKKDAFNTHLELDLNMDYLDEDD